MLSALVEKLFSSYDTPVLMAFEAWKNQHGKKYSEEENVFRFAVFKEKLQNISEHNLKYASGQSSFKMGLNHMSDMTYQEVSEMYLMNNQFNHEERKTTPIDLSQ